MSTNNGDFIDVVRASELSLDKCERLERIIALFQEATGEDPKYIVCSPGRVNLIGDHVDYHGFPVLPMAVKNSIWLACSFKRSNSGSNPGSSETAIKLFNSDRQLYPQWFGKHTFAYGSELDKTHMWHNYILCGYHGLVARELLGTTSQDIRKRTDCNILYESHLLECDNYIRELDEFAVLVDSDLPAASGLSSSSALVCASAIATSLLVAKHKWNEISCQAIKRRELAASCAEFEHLIGTHGGGMDQAVIMTAQEGFAKFVEFVPELRCENVRLPDETAWLISHCGISHHKAATSGYNARVLETKLGAAMILKKCGKHLLDPDGDGDCNFKIDASITLGAIKSKLFRDKSSAEIVAILKEEVFNGMDEFSVSEICERLELSRQEMATLFNTSDDFLREELNDKLRLSSRCEHVFEEAERVERFRSICDTTTDIALLGQIMTQSHHSLRDKYDCSHPLLDRLVSVALEAGALGARLTGAGWGGCIVTLVEASKCDTVLSRLAEVSKFTFRTEPEAGSYVIELTDF